MVILLDPEAMPGAVYFVRYWVQGRRRGTDVLKKHYWAQREVRNTAGCPIASVPIQSDSNFDALHVGEQGHQQDDGVHPRHNSRQNGIGTTV